MGIYCALSFNFFLPKSSKLLLSSWKINALPGRQATRLTGIINKWMTVLYTLKTWIDSNEADIVSIRWYLPMWCRIDWTCKCERAPNTFFFTTVTTTPISSDELKSATTIILLTLQFLKLRTPNLIMISNWILLLFVTMQSYMVNISVHKTKALLRPITLV